MKKFFVDYMDLTRHSAQFCREHALGVGIIYAVAFGVELAALWGPMIVETIKDKKEREKKEEEKLNDLNNFLEEQGF